MTFKTLLLGSAAGLVLAGGASAADLTVAEPVDYVKVCDAFGAGFFYSPGTDTCIKIGGYVKFGTNINSRDNSNGATPSFDFYGNTTYGDGKTHFGEFYTESSIQVTASSVTEYGNLTGWIDLRADTGSQYTYNPQPDAFGHIDSAYLELGPVKAGHFISAFDFLGGYTDFGAFRANQSVDHIQLTYAMGGFGFVASVEDGSDRLNPYYGSAGYTTGSYYNGSNWVEYNLGGAQPKQAPDVVAALTYAGGPINAKLSAAYVNAETVNGNSFTSYGGGNGSSITDPYVYNYNWDSKSGYAAQLGVEVALDNFSKGDKFGIQGVYAHDAPAYTGWQAFYNGDTPLWDGNIYGGFVSYIHYWNPNLWTAAEVTYLHHDASDLEDTANLWQVSASTDWSPVKNLDLMLDGSYAHTDNALVDNDAHEWSINLWMKRSW